MRATSSARSDLSRRSGRQLGGTTSRPPSRLGHGAADLGERAAHLVVGEVDADERRGCSPSGRRIASGAAPPCRAASRARRRVPPASCSSSCTTRAAAATATRGSTPRSKRLEASLGSLCRRAVRAIETGSKFAASIEHVAWCPAPISVDAPPMTPARPIGSGVVGDQQVFGVERAGLVVQRDQLLARVGAADDDAAGQLVQVVAVDRLAELEHHVVGDVDDERDRADAGELEPGDHPRRGRPGAVDAADDARRRTRSRRRGRGCGARSSIVTLKPWRARPRRAP